MASFCIRQWHKAFGCADHREAGIFYARCRRCRRAWATNVYGGPAHELDKWRAAVILDREYIS